MIRIDRRGLGIKDRGPIGVSSSFDRPFKQREDNRKKAGPVKRAWIYTQDSAFQNILDRIPLYARTELPVLITGEPGTGKELVAEALWALSLRRSQPLLKINCASISESLANSELFGHLPGAFTNALRKKRGKFELAHQGTLFFDEIGDLPLALQSRLLRAVEQGEIEPVGSECPRKVNVRLLAATNQDIRGMVPQGQFRRDLYDRLATLLIHLPPLRERRGDILLLANYFVWTTAKKYDKGMVRFSAAIEKEMLSYAWPGNVRELKNVVTRAVLLCQGSIVKELDLDPEPHLSETQAQERHSSVATLPTRPTPQELENLLRAAQGNVSALSRRLKVCTKTIYRWLRHYNIEVDSYRTCK
ncbi:MAG: sigma-54-dependent Fis family transcriptional regulator [Deltaproteobacteria bacterium]|nr:sigma-54-dependent Fis family transcriptional regulator [Deltaproteobacteria bacterium]MBW1952804.1 sigma-54-dependent Fis family transcriptional regulator [Deltaproteobacteria bacterium]MBW1987298.1 sigma-54-dependent Fis family transcriptional regulator [Deltaproteobacteria bacterium]MBW2135413.1 sigma-54-dependent Fis family transcriptional regulator [Deltaproteobacteria bacterium]